MYIGQKVLLVNPEYCVDWPDSGILVVRSLSVHGATNYENVGVREIDAKPENGGIDDFRARDFIPYKEPTE